MDGPSGQDDPSTDMPRRARRWHTIYILVCTVLLVPAAFMAFCRPYWHGYDFWEQAAAVREVAARPLRPLNPMLAHSEPYAGRFVPYTVFWGLVMRATGLSVFTTMGVAGLINYALFIFGLHRFLWRAFRRPALPVIALGVLLLVWGAGYQHANAYHLEMFFVGLPYVAFFSFGASLLALSYLAAWTDNAKWGNAALYAAISIIAFLSHPVTGVFCYVAAAALLAARSLPAADALPAARVRLRRALLMQLVPVAAVGVALVWPWFDNARLFFEGTEMGNLRENFGRAFGGGDLIRRLGGALFGVAVLVYYAVRARAWRDRARDPHLFLGLGFLLCLAVYAVAALARIGFVARFVLFAAFFLHLAIAVFLDEGFGRGFWPGGRLAWQRATAAVVAVALFGLALPYRAEEVRSQAARLEWRGGLLPAYRSPTWRFFFLEKHLTPGDVLMAYPIDGWPVPALTGAKTIAPIHSLAYLLPGLAPERLRRTADVETFFKGDISIGERRALLAKYGATHILVNLWPAVADRWGESFWRDLDELAVEVDRCDNIVIYKVRTGDETGPEPHKGP